MPIRRNILPAHKAIHRLVVAASDIWRVPIDEIYGEDRAREMVVPRHAVMYAARLVFGLSYPKIGQALGDRDHATVINGCQQIENFANRNSALYGQIRQLVKEALSMQDSGDLACPFPTKTEPTSPSSARIP